jgi:hypothetical protein
MMNGVAVYSPTVNGRNYPQIHSILYYVDKKDPTGPPPVNPSEDSQFDNWEKAVSDWAKTNVPDFASYNQPIPAGAAFNGSNQVSSGAIDISVATPSNGDFVKNPFAVKANLSASNGLASVQLNMNGNVLNSVQITTNANQYNYQYTVNAPLASQNLIILTVKDVNGESTSKSFVVYQ